MFTGWLIIVVVAAILYSWFRWVSRGAIARQLRIGRVLNTVMAAYRQGDYETALLKVEELTDGTSHTGEYCFVRGSMLQHLGRFTEAEVLLREAIPLHDDPRQKALVYNTLARVLMNQRRYAEAIAFYENAGRAWPERGANHRGIAEVWLHQGREFTEALNHARQAVEIDRQARGMKKEALHSRLGEDLGVLAWAVAANSADVKEVEGLLKEAFPLCGTKIKPTLAELHYHAGKAYEALRLPEKSREHFRQTVQLDPQGICGQSATESLASLK